MSGFHGMRRFLVIWLGQLISMIGSGFSSFALGVWLVEQTGQATPFALTVLCASLPPILLSPIAGVVADRWNRRWIMILADSGNALVTLAAVALLGTGQLAAWHVYVMAALGAACASFQEPAYRASVTMLVPKEQLGRASALSQLSQAIEMLLVPVLAGLLFAAVGLRGVFALDFISFLFAVGALFMTNIPQPPAAQADEAAPKPSLRGDIAFGWRYLRERPGLLLLIWYFALVNFLANFAAVLRTPLILGFGDARTLGIAGMAAGLGLLCGSLLIGFLAAPRRRVATIIGAIAVSGLGLGLTGLRPSGLLASAGSFIFLLGIPVAAANSEALFQSKVAPAVQGRVFAMRTMVSRSMMPLAFLAS
ncbi:MAG TPA: MFS transporter, partial [Herpetosiphonaceae bacterium]